ncbi:MAG: 50S ribosomal protein L30 [Dehalococcoidia bacterium]|nr:50S ribosomal protein L30 [Dehalococcoidia bacterium]
MARIRITWKKSAIGYEQGQRKTLKALGFRSLNQSVVHNDSLAIRGMINKVRHLVQIEEVAEE